MTENRTESFTRNMKSLPHELVHYISEYVPEEKYKMIAKDNFWSPGERDAYTGLKDSFYNLLPEYQKDLSEKIWRYGSFIQVKNTLDRWYSKDVDQNWENFIENYGNLNLNAISNIKKILEQEKWVYIGGKRLIKMRTKRRISKKRNTKKRRSKK